MQDNTRLVPPWLFVAPDHGAISCVSVSDQRLDERLIHQGNVYPSCAQALPEMRAAAHRMSEWLRAEGYAGLVGFDLPLQWAVLSLTPLGFDLGVTPLGVVTIQ